MRGTLATSKLKPTGGETFEIRIRKFPRGERPGFKTFSAINVAFAKSPRRQRGVLISFYSVVEDFSRKGSRHALTFSHGARKLGAVVVSKAGALIGPFVPSSMSRRAAKAARIKANSLGMRGRH